MGYRTRRPPTEAQRERITLRRWNRHDSRVNWYERYGILALYGAAYDDIEQAELRVAIARSLEIDVPPELTEALSVDDSLWYDAQTSDLRCGACRSENLSDFEHENWFECERCHKATPTVIGCLDCTHIRCEECAELANSQQMTMLEIAENFEVSRARIWAILQKALRKLRHPSRSKSLRPFATMLAHRLPEPHCDACSRPAQVLGHCPRCRKYICYWCRDLNVDPHDGTRCLNASVCSRPRPKTASSDPEEQFSHVGGGLFWP